MTGYTYIWEFRVRSEQRSEFERHYAPQGTWANLFRRAPGFIETILLKDELDAGHYLTIDRWQSKEQHRAFLAQFSREYTELDQECAELTIDEKPLGEYRE